LSPLKRIAFIGNSLPRRCGIATFTTDLQLATALASRDVETSIIAMNDEGRTYDYPPVVRLQVKDDVVKDYVDAAFFLNTGQYDVVSLQHEFGIFGGEAGIYLLELLSRLTMPLVTTFHTVLLDPSSAQRRVMSGIIDASSKIVVMAEKGREILETVYRVRSEKIEVIPHGIPDFPFVEPDQAKTKLGFGGRSVILTFGLLSPNKGIEVMIDAMPTILKSRPNAVYVVLGATHPNLVRRQGEIYRESLVARTREQGIEQHVVFVDRFVDRKTLLGFISMCDVYVTSYLNEAQMTSGTLAYSFGLGKAVVSTPYWHARELLSDNRGVLVPFGDSATIGKEIAALLTDPVRRRAMGVRAYSSSRSMTWERIGKRYLATFDNARQGSGLRIIARRDHVLPADDALTPPEMELGHFLSMCDDTGLLQHARHSVPDRSHGYCIDDNARALILACALNKPGERRMPEVLTARLAAFVQHAWNPETRRFRNFMSFDRVWLEDSGSEDSHGRTLWALGECARSDASLSRRRWAAALFIESLASAESFSSPRAWAFTLLGLDAYCATAPEDAFAAQMQVLLADRLMAVLAASETPDWIWFEEGLAYDNARLPQALIVTGASTRNDTYLMAGIRSLGWLAALQVAPAGYFRPIGTDSYGDKRALPRPFDQQPLEATATISASLAAWRAGGGTEWLALASRVFAWFLGGNDLSLSLVDPESGSCCDGLHADRRNENKGGESAVSYLLGLCDLRLISRISESRAKFAPRLV
jgi:glycosyltransferase involved in cell wall biosynthesis